MKAIYLITIVLVSFWPGSALAQGACDSPSHTVQEILGGSVFGEVTVVGLITSQVDPDEFMLDDGTGQIQLDFPSGEFPEIGWTIEATGVVASSEIDVTIWSECQLVPTKPDTWGRIKRRYGSQTPSDTIR